MSSVTLDIFDDLAATLPAHIYGSDVPFPVYKRRDEVVKLLGQQPQPCDTSWLIIVELD